MVPRHRSWGVPLGELEQFYEGFDGNLVDFSGVKSLKTVHLCPFMLQYGWCLDNKKNTKKIFQNWKIFYVHSWCILCTPFFSILEDAPNNLFLFNSKFYVRVPHYINIVYTHIRTYMHRYICVYTCICAYLGGETHT